jgi:CRP-like cAMP-binding protein
VKRTGNRILDALAPAPFAAIEPHLSPITLTLREIAPDVPANACYFPVDCVLSVVVATREGTIETATVGNEGIVGTHAILGREHRSARWMCQVPGRALRLDAQHFAGLWEHDPQARMVLARYLEASIHALTQTAACNRVHLVVERCARWLLTISDRVDSPDFPLTHETLATTLGVRRAGISVAAAALQAAGHIKYRRGRFHVADRDGLESAACECYAVVRDLYAHAS